MIYHVYKKKKTKNRDPPICKINYNYTAQQVARKKLTPKNCIIIIMYNYTFYYRKYSVYLNFAIVSAPHPSKLLVTPPVSLTNIPTSRSSPGFRRESQIFPPMNS